LYAVRFVHKDSECFSSQKTYWEESHHCFLFSLMQGWRAAQEMLRQKAVAPRRNELPTQKRRGASGPCRSRSHSAPVISHKLLGFRCQGIRGHVLGYAQTQLSMLFHTSKTESSSKSLRIWRECLCRPPLGLVHTRARRFAPILSTSCTGMEFSSAHDEQQVGVDTSANVSEMVA
jgi:hypothetical protein